MPARQHRHLGVYARCVVAGEVLVIRKCRGPYNGLLDLPGGGIELGEEPDAALRREFSEETGLAVGNASLRRVLSKFVRYTAEDGVVEDLHHVGLIYDVTIGGVIDGATPEPRSSPDGEDSPGAAWVAVERLDEAAVTPFAWIALSEE